MKKKSNIVRQTHIITPPPTHRIGCTKNTTVTTHLFTKMTTPPGKRKKKENKFVVLEFKYKRDKHIME